MAIQVRRGTNAVLRALVSGLNALRQGLAAGSKFVHLDTTSSSVGDPVPTAVAAVFVSPPASDLPSLLVLCRELAARHPLHVGDRLAHLQTDTTNVLTNPPPVDLPTAIVFLNDAKARWNGHLGQAGVHVNSDPQAITAPPAADLQTAMDLANTYRAVFATHIQNAFPGSFLEVIDP